MLRTRIQTLVPVAAACAVVLSPLAPLSAAHAALPPAAHAAAALPVPSHVVIVIEENHSYNQIIGSPSAPYINSLAGQGASFTDSHAITHPSQPNYLALFSGSTQGVTSDTCPQSFSAANLGSELIAAGLTFTSYSESMPSAGYTGCTSGEYARKHNPASDFTNVPAAENRTFAEFPADFSTLPTVSVVVPNLLDDMHDGTITEADTWLRDNMDAYAQWAKANNSLLIVTWDENNDAPGNQIPTLIAGAGVIPGAYGENINHYNVLRTVEDFYGLPHAGNSASATPITDIFGG